MSNRARWLFLALLLATSALAQGTRKIQEFQQTDRPAQVQKNKIGTFEEAPEHQLPVDSPIPWKAISMAALVFLIAIPFAVTAFRKAAEEQEGARAANVPDKGRTKRAAEE